VGFFKVPKNVVAELFDSGNYFGWAFARAGSDSKMGMVPILNANSFEGY